ncbi:hypothetical protein RQN30_00400 [Arcanobacterium hippocoleae]
MNETKDSQIKNIQTSAKNLPASASEPVLGKQDRCDACGAQAYVKVQLEFGVLLFCAHHAKQHAEKIADLAVDIVDETYRIQA